MNVGGHGDGLGDFCHGLPECDLSVAKQSVDDLVGGADPHGARPVSFSVICGAWKVTSPFQGPGGPGVLPGEPAGRGVGRG